LKSLDVFVIFFHQKSCHPSHITENIPYSLVLRLKRICSGVIDFLKRLDELKAKLISRGYRKNFITKAFEKVKQIDRKIALKKVENKTVQRSILYLLIHVYPMFPIFCIDFGQS
jgi:hypothetical protein